MWIRALITAPLAAAMAAASGASFAQAPAPAPRSALVQNYQAYVEAFNAHDFQRAEAEGALAADEATQSLRIGVFAVSLASLRILQLRKFAEGASPADRALTVVGRASSQRTRWSWRS